MSSAPYLGTYKAVVVDNNDPQGSYRVICQIPQVLGDAHSNWCEPTVPTIFLPRIGEIVWVQFVDGDPAFPLYQSRVHVTKDIADPSIGSGGVASDVADFSITVRKMNNHTHYLY
jgi:hypothetical protein